MCGGVGVAVGLCDAPLLAVFGVVPFLTSILSTMLPMLGAAKHDSMKVVFCCGKTGLCGVVGGCGLPTVGGVFVSSAPLWGATLRAGHPACIPKGAPMLTGAWQSSDE